MTTNLSLNMGCLSLRIENQVGLMSQRAVMKVTVKVKAFHGDQVGLMSQRAVMKVTMKVKAFHGAI